MTCTEAATSRAVKIDSSFLATGGSEPWEPGVRCCVEHERPSAVADWASSARLDGHVGCGWMVMAASSTRETS